MPAKDAPQRQETARPKQPASQPTSANDVQQMTPASAAPHIRRAPLQLAPHDVLQLQRTIGNQVVARALVVQRGGTALRAPMAIQRVITIKGSPHPTALTPEEALQLLRQFFSYQNEEEQRYGVEYRKILRELDIGDATFSDANALYTAVRLRLNQRESRGVIAQRTAPHTVHQSLMPSNVFSGQLTRQSFKFLAKSEQILREIIQQLQMYEQADLAYDFEAPVPQTGGSLVSGYMPIPDGPSVTHESPLQRDTRNEERNATRLELLGTIERLIYQWFSDTQSQPKDTNADVLLRLLEQIQAAHQAEIDLQIQQEWMFLPHDWKGLKSGELDEVRRMWRMLTTGHSNIQIETIAKQPIIQGGFAREAYAAFARLLSTKTGRALFRRLLTNAQGHTVTIRDMGRDTKLGSYGQPEPAAASPLRPEASKTPGVGSSSILGVVTGFQDTELWVEDHAGRRILTPAWLALGHELIHALHDMEGTNQHDDEKVESGWSNREEAETIGQLTVKKIEEMSDEQLFLMVKSNDVLYHIASQALQKAATKTEQLQILRKVVIDFYGLSENELRNEVGLTARKGHAGHWLKAPTVPQTQLTTVTLDEDKRKDYSEIF